MARMQAARGERAQGRRIVSVSLPAGAFEQVADAAEDSGVPMSRFIAQAATERAERMARQAARKAAA